MDTLIIIGCTSLVWIFLWLLRDTKIEKLVPRVYHVWVNDNGTAPKDKEDSFEGHIFQDENDKRTIKVKVKDPATYFDKAKKEHLRRLEIINGIV